MSKVVPDNRPVGLYVFVRNYEGSGGTWVHESILNEYRHPQSLHTSEEDMMVEARSRTVVPSHRPLGLYVYHRNYNGGGGAWVHNSETHASTKAVPVGGVEPEFPPIENRSTKVVPSHRPVGLYVYHRNYNGGGGTWVHHQETD